MKPSKLTVIGDPHAKPSNLDKISTLFDISEELCNDTVWLGDMLDTKELIRGSCMNSLYRNFEKSKLHHYVLVGNHDWFNLDCRDHSLVPLKALSNVTVVDSVISVKGIGTFVPYIHNPADFRNIVAATNDKLLFAHQGFTGFDYGNGYIAKDESNPEWIKKFDLVVSGHFHKNQESGNLIYLGTPFSQDFGESNQTKYIGQLDLKTLEMEYFETPFPNHTSVTLDCTQIKKYTKEYVPGYTRVVLTGSESDIQTFDRTNLKGVKIIERIDSKGVLVHDISEDQSNEVKFTKWAKLNKMPKKVVDLGLEIMRGIE